MLNFRIARWLRLNFGAKATSTFLERAVVLATDTGTSRTENQDRVALMRVSVAPTISPFSVVALADGMGGMSDGGECATIALSVFFSSIVRLRNQSPEEMLRLAALEANRAVFEMAQGHGGATLSAVLISRDSPVITLNLGDSRIYGWHLGDHVNEIQRLTVDDNLEEAVGGTGTELLQFCGMGPGLRPHLKIVPNEIHRLAVTSDGVHFISNYVLNDILLNTNRLADISKQLLTFARWRGSPDNASVALIDIAEMTRELQYEEPGISFTDPFNMLEIAWVRSEIPEPVEVPLPTPEEPSRVADAPPLVESKSKNKRSSPSKKKKLDNKEGNQFSIQLDATPLAVEPNPKSDDESH